MKKIISILLLVIYSSSIFAISIDVHYCAGEFSETFLIGYGGANCGCDHSKSTHTDCCTDKIISSKTDNHKTVQSYVMVETWSAVILPDYAEWLACEKNEPEIINNYNLPHGFIRSQSPYYRAFLCVFLL